jgi:GNAT superfamily N-acetyltransferase
MNISVVTKEARSEFLDMVPGLKPEGGLLLAAYEENEGAVEAPVSGVLYADGEDTDLAVKYLYVAEEKRHLGIGRQLLSSLRVMAAPLGVERILASYAKEKDTSDLDGFFTACGFAEHGAGGLSAISLGDAFDAVDGMELEWKAGDLVFLKELQSKHFYALADMLSDRVYAGDEDTSKTWLPLKNRDLYMPESVIALEEDGTPAGCLMFIRLSEKEVLLDYLCTFKNNQGRLLMAMVCAGTNALFDSCRIDSKILCHTINSVSAGLLKKLPFRKVEDLGDVVVFSQEI